MPARPETLRWDGDVDGRLVLLDQTRLPEEVVEHPCRSVAEAVEAIRSLRVRGAPAIGIAAAYGCVLGLQADLADLDAARAQLERSIEELAASRPTAVNLFWALERVGKRAQAAESVDVLRASVLEEARSIHEEDREVCRTIGALGAQLLHDGQGVLTHCNAGGLATAEYGTALAVLFTACDRGIDLHVYVDETRPLLQGSRLTAWELQQHGVPVTLICDSMAAQVMREGRVQAVITGADRIAANGDTANKIGTYGLALLARAHDVPFYVAAPSSTFDFQLASGDEIPIEQRDPAEITCGFGRRTAPEGVGVYNPAFDVTPAHLIRALITERGIIDPVTTEQIGRTLRTHGD